MDRHAHILVFDVGTSAVKTVLFDESLRPLAVSTAEYAVRAAGVCVEAAPEDYFAAMRQGVACAADGRAVDALVLTTQGETLLPVDAHGAALSNAIVWLDARAHAEAAQLSHAIDSGRFYQTTGLPGISAALPLCKLLWLRTHAPACFSKASQLLLLEDYLRLRLTGVAATHASLLTSTGYLDLHTGRYWEEALALAGIPAALLPPVLPSGAHCGDLTREGAALLGLPSGIPVYTGAMDQTAALLAAAAGRDGTVCETVGTAHVVAAATRRPRFDPARRVTIYRHALDDTFLYLPIGNTAGMALKWFRREFGQPGETYAALDALAAGVPAGCEGVTFLPFLSGCADPEPLPDATACLFGMRLSTGCAHAARAIMESTGYELRQFLALLAAFGCDTGRIVALGGGARSPFWLQMRADISGHTLETPACAEAAAAGAALLAAWGAGLVPRGTYPPSLAQANARYAPNRALQPAYDAGFSRYAALFDALRPLYAGAGAFGGPPAATEPQQPQGGSIA